MNPLTQRVFQCISQRALNPDSTLPDMDPGLHRVLEPGQALLSLCSSALAGIKVQLMSLVTAYHIVIVNLLCKCIIMERACLYIQEAFPLMRVEKKDNKGTAVWKERYMTSLCPLITCHLTPQF